MAYDNTVTIVGNLTHDPELTATTTGLLVCNFTVAQNFKLKDGSERPQFFDCQCWDPLASNIAASLRKGQRVIVMGSLNYSQWEAQDGTKRSAVRISVQAIGPELRWAQVNPSEIKKVSGGGNGAATDAPPIEV
jgi:single-strand DNA-binding protein